jgi:cysteine desulfurase
LVNSEVGTIEPVREIAKTLRAQNRKILFHIDASQAPLWMDIKADSLHADLMTLDAQKILGPKGVGALYVRRGTNLEPIIWGGSQEDGFRAGTPNTPLIGAFAVALEDAQRAAEARAQKVSEIRDYCFAEIKKLIPDVILNGPQGEHRVANNLNISIPGLEAQMAVTALDAEGVAASTRSACSAGEEEPSHVIQALGIPPELAGTSIRITFLPDITKQGARRIAQTLQNIAQRYRKVL